MRNICKLLCLILIQISIQAEYNYWLPDDFISYINRNFHLNKMNSITIVDSLINIFKDAYAFNDIANNPKQPSFDGQYYTKVNITKELEKIKDEINAGKITTNYNFLRALYNKTSELKDCHININGIFSDFLDDTYLFTPFKYNIKEENGEYKIFVEFKDDEDGCDNDLFNNIKYNEMIKNPVEKINDLDPFEYLSNLGGKFDTTKNIHGTFSYKLSNEMPLSSIPLSLGELNKLNLRFNTTETLETTYCIKSDLENERRVRRLHEKKDEAKNNKNNKNKKQKKRRMDYGINWDIKDQDEILKCLADTKNQINIIYITSFSSNKGSNFISTLSSCLTRFDTNNYPILVVNDINSGGLVYLSQIFLGILSQLIPIDLYKGRLRFSESFTITDEIRKYIITNLADKDTCSAANYDDLVKNSAIVEYGDGIKSNLSQMFLISNKTWYDKIEELRNETKIKRKPTEILFLTDGYTFSSAGLLAKYLKRNGGGIIASYMGNPKYKDKEFDIGQSPSPLFNYENVRTFSKKSFENDAMKRLKIEMPGIQSFFDDENPDVPLEYDIDLPDEKTNLYLRFNKDTYNTFVNKAKEILDKYKTECNPENKRLVKYTEECDKEFGNNYTHGGYQCGEDGKWSNKCVISNCDSGYYLDRKTNQCIKHVCSISFSSSEDDDDDSDIVVIKQKNEGYFMNLSLIIYLYSLLLLFF